MSSIGLSELKIGNILNNGELCEVFKCSPQGGMRRALKTNSLVLISNHVDAIYDDRWAEDVLHYTGMGQIGDQKLEGNQNKTLYESEKNGVDIHLFEVFEDKQYTYTGLMALADKPYQEIQPDIEGNPRLVYVFPIKRAFDSSYKPAKEQFEKPFIKKQKQARKLSDKELLAKAKQNPHQEPSSREVSSKQYIRSPWVVEHALRQANGVCQLCDSPAPFKTVDDKPFLEVHHIVWLANGGADSIDNAVALCPNCHRKMHALNIPSDVQKLKLKVKGIT
ncbi:HNH endonuclease [Thiosulfativibrio zosterae]|uniref:HNH nuclease domain-containing protein n=1 Tax=Thiosulfativibrio zosterae TaxID=2675053 RepID=A0A6F8PN51_9GAMM|nr:HNH endonuclease [Thiosulfativibrio zosterae]BBP43525.1 hypothetical protein THMIRHAT_12710 [Thiosulfativibrio zosterae]